MKSPRATVAYLGPNASVPLIQNELVGYVPMPRNCVIGTKRVRFLSENRRKRTHIENSRSHSPHKVLVYKNSANPSKQLKKGMHSTD